MINLDSFSMNMSNQKCKIRIEFKTNLHSFKLYYLIFELKHKKYILKNFKVK